jgi:hypothetical protein
MFNLKPLALPVACIIILPKNWGQNLGGIRGWEWNDILFHNTRMIANSTRIYLSGRADFVSRRRLINHAFNVNLAKKQKLVLYAFSKRTIFCIVFFRKHVIIMRSELCKGL